MTPVVFSFLFFSCLTSATYVPGLLFGAGGEMACECKSLLGLSFWRIYPLVLRPFLS